jgi:hypothetical protein
MLIFCASELATSLVPRNLPSLLSIHEPVLLLILEKVSDIAFCTCIRLSGEECTRLRLASPTYSPQSDREFQDRQELISRPIMANARC